MIPFVHATHEHVHEQGGRMFDTLATARTILTTGAHAAVEGSAELILSGALLAAAGCIVAIEKGVAGYRAVRRAARAFGAGIAAGK